MRTRDKIAWCALAGWVVFLVVDAAHAQQCPPEGCGADWRIPNHIQVPDGAVQAGQVATFPVIIEAYQPVVRMHFRFELDPKVAEFVGALAGPDIGVIGGGGSWHIDHQSWVRTANERPEHPGWQLNYLEIANWGLPDICAIEDPMWGSLGAFLDLGLRRTFHIADIIIRGNAPGTTPIWFDRVCNGEPTGGGSLPGKRDSFLTFHPWGACPSDYGGDLASASGCMQDPEPGALVTLSPGPWVPFPSKVLAPADPMVTVERPTAVEDVTWARVKRLYR